MNNEKRDILIRTAREYYSSGIENLEKQRYNSAVVLFFKSIIALVDLYILINLGSTPSSHNERFRITQERFEEVYDILDKDFPFYQDSYNILISKELAEVIKEDAERLTKETKVEL